MEGKSEISLDEIAAADKKGDKKGAKANAPRELSTRIADELAKLINAVSTDKDAESPKAAFDHGEMLAAFQRALDLAK